LTPITRAVRQNCRAGAPACRPLHRQPGAVALQVCNNVHNHGCDKDRRVFMRLPWQPVFVRL
jgi:hypothetical protein